MGKFDKRVEALELNVEGLLKLLGGTPEERQRYYETVKGITSRAEFMLVDNALAAATSQIALVHDGLDAAHGAATQIHSVTA